MHVPTLLRLKRACVFVSISIWSGCDCDDFVGNTCMQNVDGLELDKINIALLEFSLQTLDQQSKMRLEFASDQRR
jgi:hypothetical protein